MNLFAFLLALIIAIGPITARAQTSPKRQAATAGLEGAWPHFTLKSSNYWRLNLPKGERFDASGLVFSTNGNLITINDRSPVPHQVQFIPNSHDANLLPLTNLFARPEL